MRAGSGATCSARRYVYLWADGVYLQARMEPQAECMLVLIGATPEGRKELVGFQVGLRESTQSWRELLVDLKARGLAIAPAAAGGRGARGSGGARLGRHRHRRPVREPDPPATQPVVRGTCRTGHLRASAGARVDAGARRRLRDRSRFGSVHSREDQGRV